LLERVWHVLRTWCGRQPRRFSIRAASLCRKIAFRYVKAYEVLERSVLQPRLLLCLHGVGTNAGLQRMAGLESGVTAKDLAYVRRRYISSVDTLRRAIAIVADGALRARNQAIWGTATTACASNSKHFGAWDQNLTTQWHVRYGGRGVMIYWHVERNSLCIHSQLKSPSWRERRARQRTGTMTTIKETICRHQDLQTRRTLLTGLPGRCRKNAPRRAWRIAHR
jgi:hypothetical protein